MRLQLFEFGDLEFMPKFIRHGITEFLAEVSRRTDPYFPTRGRLRELLEVSGDAKLIVLGAGSGGGIFETLTELPANLEIRLTDIHPPTDFIRPADPRVTYDPRSVDARAIPPDLRGVRVFYSSFHHLDLVSAREVLAAAERDGAPIAVFEGTPRTAQGVIASLLVLPLSLIMMPLVRPFRFSRLFWTYVIPVFPLVLTWDALASTLRTSTPTEFAKLTQGLDRHRWESGYLRGPRGEQILFLIGQPQAQKQNPRLGEGVGSEKS
ncbi:MAG: hypothetical protein KF767_07470 [Bdellovibrionaceae bacterium]|nr:hypothetical protein [Pseudobdellovibrionaceae bacterium]